jgi:ribosome biogenesis GTPase / thiamine phosphate phosphatase
MARAARDYDEDDVRVRPGRRGSRPRSGLRPAHADAVRAWVVGVDRGRYTTRIGTSAAGAAGSAGAADPPIVIAVRARELGRKSVVVGDEVDLVADTSGAIGTLARIVRVVPRRTVLRRTADDSDPIERVVVANADQLVVVCSLADPEPQPRLVDRCLVAAYDAGLEPLLVLTKADLTSPAAFLGSYAPLGVPHVVTARSEQGALDAHPVLAALAGRVSVLVGASGVGKSTLVNALVPSADRVTGRVNQVTGRGRHTSTSAVALALPDDAGWVVDTPGVRSFGLAHVDLARIVHHFPDLESGTANCPRGCTHDEPECALDAWVAAGGAGPAGDARLDSLRRLLRSRTPSAGD